MTERFNSTAAGSVDGTPWQPSDETYLQANIQNDATIVRVKGRVTTGSVWVTLHTLTKSSAIPIVRVSKIPYLMITMEANVSGQSVTVNDNF